MGCWAHILAAVREVLCVYKVRESSAWRQVHSSSLRLIFQVLGLGFPILPKKRAFRNGWCWGLAHLSGCLGCDIFLPFFFRFCPSFCTPLWEDSSTQLWEVSMQLCKSLLPYKMDKLVWHDGLSRGEGDQQWGLHGQRGKMMQLVSSVTSRHNNGWTEIPVFSLFSNRDRHSYMWASRDWTIDTQVIE